jgi:hypothetical protein
MIVLWGEEENVGAGVCVLACVLIGDTLEHWQANAEIHIRPDNSIRLTFIRCRHQRLAPAFKTRPTHPWCSCLPSSAYEHQAQHPRPLQSTPSPSLPQPQQSPSATFFARISAACDSNLRSSFLHSFSHCLCSP